MTMRISSSTSRSTSLLLTMLTWSGLLEQDLLSSPTDTFWSDFVEVVKEREASESAALSKGLEEREASELAALSGGLKEREASKSAALNEGRETQVDFLEVVEGSEGSEASDSAALGRARIDFPGAETP
jgi:hypothetical protein